MQEASRLDGRCQHDFWFVVAEVYDIRQADFEKYERDDGTIVVDDLHNGVNVEMAYFEDGLLQVHVSSAPIAD